jgi:sugar O-acyltransferase (sialic acid O-acetyltransferase NeuD family)
MLIYGAGGHAKVILDYLQSLKIEVKGVFDDDINKKFLYQYPIQAYQADFLLDTLIIIAIGDNYLRKQIAQKIKHPAGQLIHPSAVVSKMSQLDEGTVVFARATIQTEAKIGKNVILNTACVLEHECQVADYGHIAPQAVICGNVKIGEGTLIGANATVLPNITIGKWCKIGAGAVVTQDIPDFVTAIGIPAKIIKH